MSAEESGLVAVGWRLEPELLREAYRHGLFPWSQDPVTWWSPPQRAVFEVGRVRINPSLRRAWKRASFSLTCNQAFGAVIRQCARPRKNEDSWIGPEFIRSYTELHHQGLAHSVECWNGRRLVGGLYGVSAGAIFSGESMFHTEANASKVALVALDHHLKNQGFRWIDSQVPNPFTRSMGAITIPRHRYLHLLRDWRDQPVTFGGPGKLSYFI